MRHLIPFALVLAVAAAVLGTASARETKSTKNTAICHRQASKARPYVKIRVNAKALKAHTRHSADIIPAPSGACPRTLLTATSGGRAFAVTLLGESEQPAGDPVGTGTATIRMRAGQGQACFQITTTNLPPAVAAHIHTGAAGTAGAVLIPLATPQDGKASGCVAAGRGVVKSVLADPASFYVNVHTAEFPGGAIRGQLAGSDPSAVGWTGTLALKGTSEPNASGTAWLRISKSTNNTCFRLHVENVTLPTVAAHIHRGATGVNGPVVVPFTAPGADGNALGCAPTTAALMDEITGNPAGFYVNVHTKEHPAGAIRAQLG